MSAGPKLDEQIKAAAQMAHELEEWDDQAENDGWVHCVNCDGRGLIARARVCDLCDGEGGWMADEGEG